MLATDRCHVLEDPWADDAVPMQFNDQVDARGPFDGIIAVGDEPAVAAAHAARRLGLRFHPPEATIAASNKNLSRSRFSSAGLLTPEYVLDGPPLRYPCVLKPIGLSASRGVIRANDPAEYRAARERIEKISDGPIQVEDYIPGREFAIEGLVASGQLQTIAIFDKPDPLEGPFFEETIYVTPSRESPEVQRAIRETAQRAISALGFTDGPVHGEMRVNDRGVWMLEAAARPIGGLCSRVLRFDDGAGLEEILLKHALGELTSPLHLTRGAHGVMMIPIPRPGVFLEAKGVEEAQSVGGIESISITAKPGQQMLPLPEGASYLGFIFARADHPAAAIEALKCAHSALRFSFASTLPIVGR